MQIISCICFVLLWKLCLSIFMNEKRTINPIHYFHYLSERVIMMYTDVKIKTVLKKINNIDKENVECEFDIL
jgi:hypothetical protein